MSSAKHFRFGSIETFVLGIITVAVLTELILVNAALGDIVPVPELVVGAAATLTLLVMAVILAAATFGFIVLAIHFLWIGVLKIVAKARRSRRKPPRNIDAPKIHLS